MANQKHVIGNGERAKCSAHSKPFSPCVECCIAQQVRRRARDKRRRGY